MGDMSTPRPALASPPPPRQPPRGYLDPYPTILVRCGAAAFVLSALITVFFASSAWPDVGPHWVLASFHVYLLYTLSFFSTSFGICMAWLARRPVLTVLAVVSLPFMGWQAWEFHAPFSAWPRSLGILALIYFLLALGFGLVTLVRGPAVPAV